MENRQNSPPSSNSAELCDNACHFLSREKNSAELGKELNVPRGLSSGF